METEATFNTETCLNQEQIRLYLELAPYFKRDSFVKSLLIARDVKGKDIARKYGFHVSEVSKVIRGERKTYTIRKAIANELGITPDVLWA